MFRVVPNVGLKLLLRFQSETLNAVISSLRKIFNSLDSLDEFLIKSP